MSHLFYNAILISRFVLVFSMKVFQVTIGDTKVLIQFGTLSLLNHLNMICHNIVFYYLLCFLSIFGLHVIHMYIILILFQYICSNIHLLPTYGFVKSLKKHFSHLDWYTFHILSSVSSCVGYFLWIFLFIENFMKLIWHCN